MWQDLNVQSHRFKTHRRCHRRKQVFPYSVCQLHHPLITMGLYNETQWIIPLWSIIMAILYNVAGRATLKGEFGESDPCLKLDIDALRDVSLLHCHSAAGLGTAAAPVHIPLLLSLLWTSAQWQPFLLSHCKGWCVTFFQGFDSKCE